jgi:hypothetical protein
MVLLLMLVVLFTRSSVLKTRAYVAAMICYHISTVISEGDNFDSSSLIPVFLLSSFLKDEQRIRNVLRHLRC